MVRKFDHESVVRQQYISYTDYIKVVFRVTLRRYITAYQLHKSFTITEADAIRVKIPVMPHLRRMWNDKNHPLKKLIEGCGTCAEMLEQCSVDIAKRSYRSLVKILDINEQKVGVSCNCNFLMVCLLSLTN